jgi:hypothetical protein
MQEKRVTKLRSSQTDNKVDTVLSWRPFERYGKEHNIPRSEQMVISRVYVYNTVITQTCSFVQVTTDVAMVENFP